MHSSKYSKSNTKPLDNVFRLVYNITNESNFVWNIDYLRLLGLRILANAENTAKIAIIANAASVFFSESSTITAIHIAPFIK